MMMRGKNWIAIALLFLGSKLLAVDAEAVIPLNEGNTSYSIHDDYVISVFSQPDLNGNTPWETTPWGISSIKNSALITDVVIESSYDLPSSSPPAEKTEEEPKPDPLPVASDKPLYRLKIGDKLSISIYGEPESTRIVTVDSAGNIYYLYVDAMYVLGKTIDQLREELNTKIKEHFKHALVAITAVNVGGEYYTILGEVIEPGQKILHGKETLLMAMGVAGGLTRGPFRNHTIEYADLNKAFLTRRGEYIPIDFAKLIEQGDMSQDIELMNGDYIFVPTSMTHQIFILGEVFAPTTLVYMNAVSLVEAIAEAQGLMPNASSRVIVLRGSLACPTHYLVDFNSILRRCEPDFMLEPGDIVYVPPRRFTLLREIVRSGLRAFVSTLASVAGTNTYFSITPSAIGNTVTPVNVITTPVSTSQAVIVPVQ